MNESKFPLTSELSDFENDLKSLTPRTSLSKQLNASEIVSQGDLNTTANECVRIGDPIGLQHEPSRQFQNIALSWTCGLAAGLLVSALWHQWPSRTDISLREASVANSLHTTATTVNTDPSFEPNPPDMLELDFSGFQPSTTQLIWESNATERISTISKLSQIHRGYVRDSILNPMDSWRIRDESEVQSTRLRPFREPTIGVNEPENQEQSPSPPGDTLPFSDIPSLNGNSDLKPAKQHQLLKLLLKEV